MKKNIKKSFVILLQIMLCISFLGSAIADEPTIESITVSPEKPYPRSELTFTAEITGENITEVYVRVEEANDIFCYQDFHNVSMENIDTKIYKCNVTLIHEDTTIIYYWLIIKCNGTWYEFSDEKYTNDIYPELNISSPKKGYFHILGKPITKTILGKTVLLGKTKIIIDIGTYFKEDIEKIEFYINNNFTGTINRNTLEWNWKSFSFGIYSIEIRAYVSESNYINKKIEVIAFIL